VAVEMDSAPPGFATARLASAATLPGTGDPASRRSTGALWYTVSGTATAAQPDGQIEWYLHGERLQAGRAYRVEVSVDGRNTYSLGNGRANGLGRLTLHGILTSFADRYCVSAPTPRSPITGQHTISFALKADGSGTGAASEAAMLTDPTDTYPCNGNADGDFGYWLVSDAPVDIGQSQ